MVVPAVSQRVTPSSILTFLALVRPLIAHTVTSSNLAASPPAGEWAELLVVEPHAAARTSLARCVSRIGNSGPIIQTYSCVDPLAPNAPNQLFQLSKAGEWQCQGGTPSSRCVGATACPGSTGLCLTECTNSTRWTAKNAGTSSGQPAFTLSPAEAPHQCLALAASSLELKLCTSRSTRFAWRAAVKPPPPPPPVVLHLNGHSAGREFDGHGLLSAGASSRLLRDYREPQRSQILDYLFKPSFGASLDIIKVEIGGDLQSTSGTEPSHMHSRNDLGCGRGYEGFILTEAKRRNPSIKTWGLSWGVPAWISRGQFANSSALSYFSQDNVEYQTAWVKCIKETTGITIDYLGIWNERSYGPVEYAIALRKNLDNAGFQTTKIVLPDNPITQDLVDQLTTNAAFSNAVYALGTHECGHVSWTGDFSQKGWCAEEEVANGWAAAKTWGPLLNQNFISANQTSTTSWSLIWSVPEALSPYQNRGAMMASSPWSGFYYVDPTIWMHAHWTQVTEPGWKILGVEGGGSGYLDGSTSDGGTFVTVVSPDGEDFSVVLERLHTSATAAVNVTLMLSNLPAKALSLWVTSSDAYFVEDKQPLQVVNGSITVLVQAQAIYSLTTLTSVTHGNFTDPVPPSAPFPLPYYDDFDSYSNDSTPKFLADQGGSFSVTVSDGGGVLQQMCPVDPGPNAWVANQEPITLIGDLSWTDYTVSAHAKLLQSTISDEDSGASNPAPLQLLPCTSLPSISEQVWVESAPPSGVVQFRSNVSGLCLSQNGAGHGQRSPVTLQKCTDAGVGIGAGANESWQLSSATGQLIATATGLCATVISQGADHKVFAVDCKPALPTQQWKFEDGQLKSTGMCLSARPVEKYLAVCARIGAFAAFSGFNANAGVCLRLIYVHGTLAWSIRESTTVLASGKLTARVSSTSGANDWHELSLSIVGTVATGMVDGVVVGATNCQKATHGMASLGSSYGASFFDNLTIVNASAGPAVIDGEPTGGKIKMPEFSWGTLPVAWHSGNSTGQYTDAQIKELARYQMVTLEKFQNVRAVVPAEVLARGYESPGGLYECQRNASLRMCGCCGEDEIVAVARKIKAVNPKVVTVAYFNAEIAYPWYRATRVLAQNPTWWNAQHYGPTSATWKGWNLTVAAAAAAWQQGCLDVTRTGVVDTCFVDGCSDWGSSLDAAAKRTAIAELQTNVPGPLMCGAGGSFTENELLRSGARGFHDESWGLIDQETGKGTFATREIPGLMAAARAGVVFQAHGRAVCGLAGKPCDNRTQPCWNALPDYRDPAVQTELAAFLVAMGEYSYYVCGSWENYPANASTWNPVYDLPLGKPRGDATLGNDMVWRRAFTSGTTASFDTKTNTGLVSWASQLPVSWELTDQ